MRGDHCRLDPIINKANKKQKGRQLVLKKGAEANTLEWPCVAPFSPASENASYGIAVSSDKENKPVAHVVVAESNLDQVKDVRISRQIDEQIVHDLAQVKGLFPRRLSSIPSNRLSFEKCRVIIRNLPFNVPFASLEDVDKRDEAVQSIQRARARARRAAADARGGERQAVSGLRLRAVLLQPGRGGRDRGAEWRDGERE